MFLRGSDFHGLLMFPSFWYFNISSLKLCVPREGSVIADLELTFNSSTYEDYLRERLQDATKDNKLGDLEVKDVVVGGFFSTGELLCLISPRYFVDVR